MMTRARLARLRRLLLPALALGNIGATTAAPPRAGFAAPPPSAGARAVPARAGAEEDLYHLDTETALYTRGDDGATHLRLFNSPVGIPSLDGWRLRDPGLAPSSTGMITPANLPFDLRIAPRNDARTLVTLAPAPGRIALGVGLLSAGGVTPARATGRVAGDTVTYPAVVPSRGDVTVRATSLGMELGLVLRDAGAAGRLALAPDPRTRLERQPGGGIVALRRLSPAAEVQREPEQVVGPAIAVDSNPDPAALARPGRVAMALAAPGPDGRQALTLTVDPAWLRDPARVFPVRLRLPVALAGAAMNTGLLGTVDSCAPDVPGAPALVVGAEGGCAYHGLLRFDLGRLVGIGGVRVTTATLRLYTPDHTGPTGVRVYPNAPAPDVEPQLGRPLPTWKGAPVVMTGTAGIAQGASDGHWQSWDITPLVRQWRQRGYSYDTGVTLVGTGAPVLFASPFEGATSLATSSGVPATPAASPIAPVTNTTTSTLPVASATPAAVISPGAPGLPAAVNALSRPLVSRSAALRARVGHARRVGVAGLARVASWRGQAPGRHSDSSIARILRGAKAWSPLAARLGTRARLRTRLAALGDLPTDYVSVPSQCYLVPGAPYLCIPMTSPPNITVGPPAVGVPTPPQCVLIQNSTLCIPFFGVESCIEYIQYINQPMCKSLITPSINTPAKCVTWPYANLCIPSTAPTPLNPARCYPIPGLGQCLPLIVRVNPSLPRTQATPVAPPRAAPTPIGGAPVHQGLTIPTSAAFLGCLAQFGQTSSINAAQPVAPLQAASCENVVAPTVDLVYYRPIQSNSPAPQYGGPRRQGVAAPTATTPTTTSASRRAAGTRATWTS